MCGARTGEGEAPNTATSNQERRNNPAEKKKNKNRKRKNSWQGSHRRRRRRRRLLCPAGFQATPSPQQQTADRQPRWGEEEEDELLAWPREAAIPPSQRI